MFGNGAVTGTVITAVPLNLILSVLLSVTVVWFVAAVSMTLLGMLVYQVAITMPPMFFIAAWASG